MTEHENQKEVVIWLRRIFGLCALSLPLLCLIAWEVHGIKSAIAQMEEKMPSVTITVTATRGSNSEVVVAPITTTQGEIDPEETRAAWIARTQATAADWKSAIENS